MSAPQSTEEVTSVAVCVAAEAVSVAAEAVSAMAEKPMDKCAMADKPTEECAVAEKPMEKYAMTDKPTEKCAMADKPTEECAVAEKPMEKCAMASIAAGYVEAVRVETGVELQATDEVVGRGSSAATARTSQPGGTGAEGLVIESELGLVLSEPVRSKSQEIHVK
jgi:hypothetical protein